MIGRRQFLHFTLKNAFLITAGNQLLPILTQGGTLPSSSRIALRFAIASDGHYGQEKTEYEAKHDLVIRALNTESKGRGIDFAVINGDLFHNDPAQFEPVKKKWDELHMTWHASHGNHDMVDEETWKKVTGRDWYYGFEQGSCGFLVLNTADAAGEYTCPDLNRTKALLDEYAHHQFLFVFMHITPRKWTGAGIDCPGVVNLFNQHGNLKAVFHGHDHDQQGAWTKDGVSYLFDGHVAGNWGLPYLGYRIVEVLKDGTILTYQMDAGPGLEVNRYALGRSR